MKAIISYKLKEHCMHMKMTINSYFSASPERIKTRSESRHLEPQYWANWRNNMAFKIQGPRETEINNWGGQLNLVLWEYHDSVVDEMVNRVKILFFGVSDTYNIQKYLCHISTLIIS